MIRVGLIGYGYAGRTFHAPLIRATEGLALCRVGSRQAALVHADVPEAAVGEAHAVAIAPDCDLVVIATPNDTHHPLAAAALDAGKHVVVDKPLALTLADAGDLAARAARRGTMLSVFHNRRWDSDFLGARAILASGRLGHVSHFESRFDRFRPLVQDRWRERAGAGSGGWLDLGPHLVDQALQLFGMPRAVSALIAALRPGAAADDWASVLLDYGERVALLRASMLVAGGAPRLALHGTGGTWIKVAADRQEAQLKRGLRPGTEDWGVDPDSATLFDGEQRTTRLSVPAGDYRRYYAGVRDAIATGAPPPVTAAEAVQVMAVVEAAATSAATGRRIALTTPGS